MHCPSCTCKGPRTITYSGAFSPKGIVTAEYGSLFHDTKSNTVWEMTLKGGGFHGWVLVDLPARYP